MSSRSTHPQLLVALVLSIGCSGQIEQWDNTALATPVADASMPVAPALGAPDGGSASVSCNAVQDVGPSALRRLSNVELQLTLQDLFLLDTAPSVDDVPADNEKDGFKTFTEVQALSAQHLRAYLQLSGQLADALLSDQRRRAAVIGCEPTAVDCLRAFSARFGRLAYRRTLDTQEITALTTRAQTNALDDTDAFRYVIQSLLTSADFLYRVEIGDQPDALSKLTPTELATRLSFALWGRAPSVELLDAAEAGTLSSADGLRRTVQTMLADPRTQTAYRSFFRQWLGYDKLRAPQVAPAGWSDALLVDMQQETDAALVKHAFGNGSLLAALTTDETTLSAPLAALYGLPAPDATGKVQIPTSHPRAHAGILGHASLLSMKSDGDMIALRGNWLRRTFFCASLSIPPDVAADLGDLLVGLTRVEIVEKRNTEAACKGCHALIDPIGVGLAAFDATGRWDAMAAADLGQYGIAPAVPDLASPSFDSLATLASKLQAAPEVARCLTDKVFVYVTGHAPAAADRCLTSRATAAFADDAAAFRSLLGGMVESESFRLRRAPAVTGEP